MLQEFESLLKQAIGLEAASVGSSTVRRAVQQRVIACGCTGWNDYWEHLRASNKELQELIESVVVPETWFFRDKGAFAALASLVTEEWIRPFRKGVLHMLSVPCSTGEEPYSMAMTLLDCGLPPEQFQIEAVDISGRALSQARLATYGRNSFRSTDLTFRERYFCNHSQNYELTEGVRKRVSFRQGNLLDPGFSSSKGCYDIIFCRNLLIYFGRPTQDKAVRILSRLLHEKGILFVGSAETGLMLNHGLAPAAFPLAFAFRKTSSVGLKELDGQLTHARRKRTSPVHMAASLPKLTKPSHPKSMPKHGPRTSGEFLPAWNNDLDGALELADKGRLAEAAAICKTHLQQHGPSAKAFHLLGLVSGAAGNPIEAGEYYRKALYLEPNHYEALVHMALLAEKLGNVSDARVLQDRARRVKKRMGD